MEQPLRMVLAASFLALAFFVNAVNAAPPHRVEDLAPASVEESADPERFVPVPGGLIFRAKDGVHGRELWFTDGTEPGTRLLHEIKPGREFGYPAPIASLPDGRLFFYSEVRGELWITDGSRAGTRRLAVPCPGCSPVMSGAVAGETLVFRATDTVHGSELWRSDGTREGTGLLLDIVPGAESSSTGGFTSFGDLVIFYADDRVTGAEPWVSDGTPQGTFRLKDLCADCSSLPRGFTALENRVVFTANDGIHGLEPWVSDGTAAGTRMLGDLQPGDNSSGPFLVPLAGRIFGACSSTDCAFSTDGTPEGTRLEPVLAPQGNGINTLRATGSHLFFRMSVPGGHQIWSSDGTAQGTVELLTTSSYGVRGKVGDLLYFEAGGVIYVSDGTLVGTRELPGVEISEGHELDGKLVFGGAGTGSGPELWSTDGTTGGTEALKDFVDARGDANIQQLEPWGEGVAFLATDNGLSSGPNGLWFSNGENITLLERGRFDQPTVVGNRLFALSFDGLVVSEPQGAQILDTGEGAFRRDPVAWRDLLYLSVSNPGQQIWSSDGTEEGTRMIADVHPEWVTGCTGGGGCPPGAPRNLTPMGNQLFFGAHGVHDPELWVTDGTAAGTRRLRSFGPISISTFEETPFHLIAAEEHLFFWVNSVQIGIELWVSDGTTAGTRLVADLSPGPASSTVRHPTALGDNVVFALAGDATRTGDDLWIANHSGAQLLADLGPSGVVREIVQSAGRLFLSIDTLDTGQELWVSDGTAAGTRRLDLLPGSDSAAVSNLSPIPGGVFFAASDGTQGLEPWVSFGNLGSSGPLADLYSGEKSSSPSEAMIAGDKIFFEADDGIADRELFVADLEGLLPSCPTGHTCLHGGRFAVQVEWRDYEGQAGTAQEAFVSDTSALLWFFEPDNWELVVKVIDGCTLNNRFWVFSAAATDVEYTLQVTDLWSGETWSHHHPPGQPAPAVTETEALATCNTSPPGVRSVLHDVQ